MGLFDFFRKKKLAAGSDAEQGESGPEHATASTPNAKVPTLTRFDDVPTLTEDTLQAVEEKYGFQLPLDYRKFLLADNGGFPLPDCVTFSEAGRNTASEEGPTRMPE